MKPGLSSSILNKTIFALLFSLVSVSSFAQTNTPTSTANYINVITQRADKIVATLGIADTSKAAAVRNIIRDQYSNLNDIHTNRDNHIKAVKAKENITKEALAADVKSYEDAADVKLQKLHADYLSKLSKYLNAQQIDKVKDGMTYSVLPITYKGYLSMLPNLTSKQKDQIMVWLVEAREHAIDAETSEKKHGWFGKYKGRINNYLSAAGYDLKKEGEDWQKRIKATEAAAKN